MKLDELKIDTDKLEKGDWVENIPELEGLRLKVRGVNNKAYRKMERQLLETLPRSKRRYGRLNIEDQDRITTQCLLNSCLDDWDGLFNDNGTAIPYTREMAQQLLTEPEYRRFRDAVLWAANVVVEDQATDEDDIAKN